MFAYEKKKERKITETESYCEKKRKKMNSNV